MASKLTEEALRNGAPDPPWRQPVDGEGHNAETLAGSASAIFDHFLGSELHQSFGYGRVRAAWIQTFETFLDDGVIEVSEED